jgi:predicted methyltransferase
MMREMMMTGFAPARRTLFGFAAALSVLPMLANAATTEDKALKTAIAGKWRLPANAARDQYRHPYETLTFWGLKPGMKVIEIEPGAGWWIEILAPYAKATGGSYAAALPDRNEADISIGAKTGRDKAHADFWAEVADKSVYGEVKAYDFGPKALDNLPAASADMILVARAFHNWSRQARTELYLLAFFRALKPGGILAVEQHRAPEGSDPKAGTGYVPESYVIEAAKAAGFVFEAKSEINANAKDTRDHPFGVWTLPPIRRSNDQTKTLTPEERAKFDAIGESDRMTLRFRKPK